MLVLEEAIQFVSANLLTQCMCVCMVFTIWFNVGERHFVHYFMCMSGLRVGSLLCFCYQLRKKLGDYAVWTFVGLFKIIGCTLSLRKGISHARRRCIVNDHYVSDTIIKESYVRMRFKRVQNVHRMMVLALLIIL